MTTLRAGGQILVDQLRINGCDRVLTVPGESDLAALDALNDSTIGQAIPYRLGFC